MIERTTHLWLFWMVLAGALMAPGCGSETDDISEPPYLLGLLDRYWLAAREAVATNSDDLMSFRAIQANLNGRVRASVAGSYTGEGKEAVVAKLGELSDAFAERILPLFSTTSRAAELRPGVTRQQFGAAFAEVDKIYRELTELTSAG